MYKNILARGPLNKTVALGSVKPLYCTFLSHNPLLSTTNLESPLLRGRSLPVPPTVQHRARTRVDSLEKQAGKTSLRRRETRVAAQLAVFVQRKKPHEFTLTEQDCSVVVDPWNPCNACNTTADRNINPNPRFGGPESSSSAQSKGGANDNYRELCFFASISCTETSGCSHNRTGQPARDKVIRSRPSANSATIASDAMTGSTGTSGLGSPPKTARTLRRTRPPPPRASRLTPLELHDLHSTAAASGHGRQTPAGGRSARRNLPVPARDLQPFASAALSRLSTLRYLMQTEVHTYAFSVAANSILSFFPFIVLLLTIVHRVFHSAAMYDVVLQLLRDYLPSNKDFVIRNLQFLASVRGRGQVLSFFMLLITSTGIFLPLEVALNSIWGFKKNRSYLMNLLVSLGLALRLRMPGHAVDRADRAEPAAAGALYRRRKRRLPGAGLRGDEGVRHRRDHRHLLPHLLAAAARKGPGARGAAGGHHHRSCCRKARSTSTSWFCRG